MVVVEITRWPTPARGPLGRVTEVLGDIDEPGVDNEIIIRKYGIPDAHSHGSRRGSAPDRHVGAARRTFAAARISVRSSPSPSTASTPATSTTRSRIEKLPNGNYWLGVHIADVAHYVQEGGASTKRRTIAGTSVYFPDRAVHMFPSELSTGLCSLNPHVDRLVQSCLMEVDRRGAVVRYELHDGVIHSNARMTYTEVNAILTDRDPETIARYQELVPLFETMHELFEILNKRRHRRGSIDFDLKEPEIVLDDEGMVEAIIAAERNVAHRIIEEFMLLANETVAQHLDEHDVPTLYRIHEEPDPAQGGGIRGVRHDARLQPCRAARRVKPRHFQKLVEKMHGTPEEKPIAFLMLRTMQKARTTNRTSGTSVWRRRATRISPRRSAAIRTWSCTAPCASRVTGR